MTLVPERRKNRLGTGQTAPVDRGQGVFAPRNPFTAYGPQDRGQSVPYDVNGVPIPAAEPKALVLDINGLPLADPTQPLWECLIPAGGKVFTGVGDHLSAGVGATSPSALRLFKNGVANGTITFTGTAGVVVFSDSTFAEGDLFSLYPPSSIDATLDRVRVTLGTD